MPEYGDWESLVAAVEDKIPKILEGYAFAPTKKVVLRHIFNDIYGATAPKAGAWVRRTTYRRRYSLLSEGNIYHELQDGGSTLMVTSNAAPSPSVVPGYSFHNRRPGAFLQLLESGNLGINARGFPRPAISNAQKEIDSQLGSTTSEIGAAIQAGLDRYLR